MIADSQREGEGSSAVVDSELALVNGQIRTMASPTTVVEAVLIRADRIAAIGTSAYIRRLRSRAGTIVDLQGKAALPGLNDCHNHMLATGLGLSKVQLHECTSLAQVLDALRSRAESTERGEWIEASSRWHESKLVEGLLPNRGQLDEACPNHPVFLPRGGHVAVVNSLALVAAGIQDSTPDPPGGKFVRDEHGRPTGEIHERPAINLFLRMLPQPSGARRKQALRSVMERYNQVGLTSVRDPGLTATEIHAYQDIWRDGQMTVRTSVLPRVDPSEDEAEQLHHLQAMGVVSGFGDGWLRLGALKIVLDGGIEGGLMSQSYVTNDGFYGIQVFDSDRYRRLVLEANRQGWQVATHTVGDKALDLVLDVYGEADAEASLGGRRWSVEHGMVVRADQIERLKQLDIVVTHQHPLVYSLGANILKHWGRQRADQTSPVRSLLEKRLHVGGGSDSPVTPFEPFLGIWGCVTRSTELCGVFGGNQSIGRFEALSLYTTGSAYVSGEEGQKGTIEAGKVADLIVTSQDPMTCEVDALKHLPVDMTVLGGRVVYSRI